MPNAKAGVVPLTRNQLPLAVRHAHGLFAHYAVFNDSIMVQKKKKKVILDSKSPLANWREALPQAKVPYSFALVARACDAAGLGRIDLTPLIRASEESSIVAWGASSSHVSQTDTVAARILLITLLKRHGDDIAGLVNDADVGAMIAFLQREAPTISVGFFQDLAAVVACWSACIALSAASAVVQTREAKVDPIGVLTAVGDFKGVQDYGTALYEAYSQLSLGEFLRHMPINFDFNQALFLALCVPPPPGAGGYSNKILYLGRLCGLGDLLLGGTDRMIKATRINSVFRRQLEKIESRDPVRNLIEMFSDSILVNEK